MWRPVAFPKTPATGSTVRKPRVVSGLVGDGWMASEGRDGDAFGETLSM